MEWRSGAEPSDGLLRILPGERERQRWREGGGRRGGAGLESGITAGHLHVINVEVESSWAVCLDLPDNAFSPQPDCDLNISPGTAHSIPTPSSSSGGGNILFTGQHCKLTPDCHPTAISDPAK